MGLFEVLSLKGNIAWLKNERFIHAHVVLGDKKFKTILKMAGFYTKWYIGSCIKTLKTFIPIPGSSSLSCHLRFIERKTQKLARSVFHSMMMYQARLEKKQTHLGHIIEIAIELFAMSASISYAQMLCKKNTQDTSPHELADLFCRNARRRIHAHFGGLRWNDTNKANI